MFSKKLGLLVIVWVFSLGPVSLLALDSNSVDARDTGPIRSGYAVITPASSGGLVVFETFGLRRGIETTQAGILSSNMATKSVIFVSTNGRLARNLGVAIANPNSTDANVTVTLRGADGTELGSTTVVVKARNQTAQFVTGMFADRASVPKDVTGSLVITSDIAVAVIGLRFRGENFSAIPVTNLTAPVSVPMIAPGVGGPGAVILPHFVSGGGWAAEIVLMNSGIASLTVRLDLFKQDGMPLAVNLNNESNSSFLNLTIPAGGVLILSARDNNGDSDF